MKNKKMAMVLCIFIVSALLLSACGNTPAPSSSDVSSKSTGTATATTQPTEIATPKLLAENEKLTYWVTMSDAASVIKNFNEMSMYKEIEKLTGVHIDFIHPAAGSESEQFKIMIASSNLPDIIDTNWSDYAGGLEKAFQDGVIIKINDLVEKYSPNYNGLIQENNYYGKNLFSDNGNLYIYACLIENPSVYYGPIVRQDWLDKLGIGLPETLDEWYLMLKAIKQTDLNGNGKNDEIPFGEKATSGISGLLNGNAILSAWNITPSFFVENDKIQFGPIRSEYKEYLSTMRKWYKEGLLDQEFASTDSKLLDAKVTGELIGSFYGYSGGGIQKYMSSMKDKNPSFKLAGVKNPVLIKGSKPTLGQMSEPIYPTNGAVITSANKKQELSAKWLDFMYSEAGTNYNNYGVEGVSYKVDNGKPNYIDSEIFNNKEGLGLSAALSKHCRAAFGGPFFETDRMIELFTAMPEQVAAVKMWSDCNYDRKLPKALTPTADESERLGAITGEVNAYIETMNLKFIMGQEPLEKFDEYIKSIKNMKIDEAILIEQAAYDRYLKR